MYNIYTVFFEALSMSLSNYIPYQYRVYIYTYIYIHIYILIYIYILMYRYTLVYVAETICWRIPSQLLGWWDPPLLSSTSGLLALLAIPCIIWQPYNQKKKQKHGLSGWWRFPYTLATNYTPMHHNLLTAGSWGIWIESVYDNFWVYCWYPS